MNRHPCDTAAPSGHRYVVRVYLEDTDAGGIAYHASYLRFAERGRTEALRDLGLPHAEMVRTHGAMFVVRRLKIDYLRPARFDDLLTVVTEPLRVRAASVLIAQRVEGPGGALLVDMELLLACARVSDGRAVRLPAAWHEALIAMHAQGAGADSTAGDTDAREAASQDAPSGARRD